MRKIFLFILLSIFSLHLFSENFSFRHYKVENGLSFNTVRCLLQDRQGFIWIGTENGLNKFDGYKFKVFSSGVDGAENLRSDYINNLLEAHDGKIFIGTNIGISLYDPVLEKFSNFDAQTPMGVRITSEISSLSMDAKGVIWISTYGQGIFRYSTDTGQLEQFLYISSSTLPYQMIDYVYADKKGVVWAITRNSDVAVLKFNFDQNIFEKHEIYISESGKRLTSLSQIYLDSKGNYWIGTFYQGLYKFDASKGLVYNYIEPEGENGVRHIHHIMEQSPGKLLIGSDDGLSFFDTETRIHKRMEPRESDQYSLSDKFVYPILKDREGGIWVGTYYGGLNYASPYSGAFERYTHSKYRNSVGGKVINGFTEDIHGNIWIASDDGGLNQLNTKTGLFKTFMPNNGPNSISFHNVHALCWDNEDLWIGTYTGGVNILNTKTGRFKNYDHQTEDLRTIDNGSIFAIYKDHSNTIWLGSMTGINKFDREKDDFHRVKKIGAITSSIVEDRNNNIWIGTWGKGLICHNPEKNDWEYFLHEADNENSIADNQINCLYPDGDQIWVGTTNGLCIFDTNTQIAKQVRLRSLSQNICGIIKVNNYFWITTSRGLIRYNPESENTRVFTHSDGLLSDQFINNAIYASSEGKIYMGTSNGFNAFKPNEIPTTSYSPPVEFTNLEIFNQSVIPGVEGSPLTKSIGYSDKIELNYKQSVFSIEFVTPSYNSPEKVQYSYKLEDFDKDWNDVRNLHKATYTNLSAGNYTLKVRSTNNEGVYNNSFSKINIVIHPPIWLTLGFKILYAVLFILLLIYIYFSIKRKAEKVHNLKIEKLHQEKEREMHQSKIQFFTMIAHEIRTPVSLIIGPVDKLKNLAGQLPEMIRKDFEHIDRNSQRLLTLVNQLLDFRKAEQQSFKIEPKKQNIVEIIRNVSDRFNGQFVYQHKQLYFESDRENVIALVDAEALIKIISNLLSNGLKFSESKVVIRCFVNSFEESFQIQITDDGIGISEEDKTKIFQPFYQVNYGTLPGTGLGLSLVKNLLNSLNGTIEVHNSIPKGTTFMINLPLGVSVDEALEYGSFDDDKLNEIDEPVSRIQPSKKKNQIKLLVVEDNHEMRTFLSDSLSDEYFVVLAFDGIDALEKLEKIEVDMIISDLMMPRMDGIEFCQKIRNNVHLSHIPIILLTAKTNLESKIEGMECGADAYMEKPFSLSYLKAQINNLFEIREALQAKFSKAPVFNLDKIASNEADKEFLSKINEILELNLSNSSFSMDTLAKEMFISRSGLFSKIKSLAGITPNELLQVMRLKKAAEILSTNQYRVNEIAFMVGFNNPSYFTKCFQKQFGVRPLDYMKNE